MVIIEKNNSRLYKFNKFEEDKNYISFENLNLHESLKEYEMRYDLVDTGLYLCNAFREN